MCSQLKIASWQLFIGMLANCLGWMILSVLKIGLLVELGVYINIIICGLLVLRISTGDEILQISRRVDKAIGDFSFPVYLLHYQCGFVASFLLFGDPFHEFSVRGFASFTLALCVVIALSSVFIFAIDFPLQRIRKRVRRKSTRMADDELG